MSQPQGRRVQIVAASFLVLVALGALFTWGIAVGRFQTGPYPLFDAAYQEYTKLQEQMGETAARVGVQTKRLPHHYKRLPAVLPIVQHPQQRFEGINLVTRIARGSEMSVDIVDMDGQSIHSWNVDWFEVWPDADHVAEFYLPKTKPGSHIHGAVVMPDGDLVFNYEHLGLVSLSRDSQVRWRLPYRTHHSVHLHDDGMLWVSGQRFEDEADPRFPQRPPPFDKYTILRVNPADGSIVSEWDVADILHDNGYGNLLYLVPVNAKGLVQVKDDRLHLNDVEPFPSTMEAGFFGPGDVLVSLRDISTVFVFNTETGKIKFITTGVFSQQHDPDFLDGNRFSTFDNNAKPQVKGAYLGSRIVVINAATGDIDVVYEGTRKQRFYTPYMGKHQWLPNGNILITESLMGRGFEVNAQGEIVWQYINQVGDDLVALVEEVTRLPLGYAGFSTAPAEKAGATNAVQDAN